MHFSPATNATRNRQNPVPLPKLAYVADREGRSPVLEKVPQKERKSNARGKPSAEPTVQIAVVGHIQGRGQVVGAGTVGAPRRRVRR